MFPSSIWLLRNRQNDEYLFESMMRITKSMSEKIDNSMRSIFEHLQTHKEWPKLKAIANQTVVERQDDERVGLLIEKGIREVVEAKQVDEADDGNDAATFIDTNLAVNMLTTTAKNLNAEFQGRLGGVMSRYGEFRAGPVKSVERCQSKLENEYPGAEYPKAAKLLDVVRCSVSFNTLEQLLTGYDGLMRYVQTTPASFQLARVKNGFLEQEAAFRAIKVNVVYHSEQDPENPVHMICEVQLILNQYLHEKKRIHKLYSILRERAYFEMVVTADDDNKERVKDIKQLKFEPVLNVNKDVQLNYNAQGYFFKGSIDSDLGLLGVSCGFGGVKFVCVDMATKKAIFERKSSGKHGHHWISINKQKYLSMQTKCSVQMFKINEENNVFEEDAALRLSVGDGDRINYSEFDRYFKNIFILKNYTILESRSISDLNKVNLSINLENQVSSGSSSNVMSLSNDGTYCAIGGGWSKPYFYLIDLQKKEQFKIVSQIMKHSLDPCFINGEAEFVAIGSDGVEIWDVQKRESIKTLEITSAFATASTNNILAAASSSGEIRLWDVRNWDMFYSTKFHGVSARSLHLTTDSKYLTLSGQTGGCIVMQIK